MNEPTTKTAKVTDVPADGYLLKHEIAARLRRTPKTIERMMHDRQIPFIKMGTGRRSPVLFKWADVQAHLENQYGVVAR